MKRLVLLVFFFVTAASLAQDFKYLNDAQVWFNLYLEKKINKKWALHLNQQDRWTNNISQYELGYADAGFTYKFTKDIKVLADYVFTQKKRNDGSYSTRHQYYVAITFKKDYRRWRFMYRNMFQFQFNDPYTSQDGMIAYYYERNKFIIKYEFNKYLSFYTAEELYLPLNNLQLKALDRSRSFIGMFINTFRRQQLEFYFMLQAQLDYGDWYKQHHSYPGQLLEHDYIYGIGYSFEF